MNRFFILFLFTFLVPGSLLAADFADWSQSKKFYLNTTSSGANIAEDVYAFPVLIKLDASNFTFSEAAAQGEDIRFSKSDGVTPVPFEIVSWTAGIGYAEIWFLADTVYGNNREQYFLMYWGNDSASNQSDDAAVFDTAHNFEGVWHLDNVNDVKDATYLKNTGTNTGAAVVSGIIGNAANFNGIGFIDLPVTSLSGVTSQITISLWQYGDPVLQPKDDILFSASAEVNQLMYVFLPHANSYVYFYLGSPAEGGTKYSSFPPDWKGRWNYWVFTKNTITGKMRAYVNGIEWMLLSGFSNPLMGVTNFSLGADAHDHSKNYNGYIDEFRISGVERSAAWVRLNYENQRTHQSLVQENLLSEEAYSNWDHQMPVYLNTTSTGADIASNISDFPVLIRLNNKNFSFLDTRPNGEDIRFAKSDGTPMHYEIERWDATIDSVEIWVLVDTVYGNSSNKYFNMYWGNSSAESKSNGAAVFSRKKGFKGVWHLNHVDSVTDAAGNTPNGSSGSVTEVNGNIGGAAGFSGTSYISLPPTALTGISTQVTVSLWQYGDAAIQPQADYMFHANEGGNDVLISYLPYDNSHVYWYAGNPMDGIIKAMGRPEDYEGRWNHWVFTKNTTTGYMRLYLNGAEWFSSMGWTNQLNGASGFAIGANSYDKSRNYDGFIDEFRLSNRERTHGWIKLSYENQRLDQQFVWFNDEDYAANWDDSTKILLNTTVSGAHISNSQTSFPLLIRLNGQNFDFSTVNDGGTSIRFSTATGEWLYHDIERWIDSLEVAEIWVKLDTVYSNSNNQYIIMWWDNRDKGDRCRSDMVFNRGDGFAAVWHLQEDGNTDYDGYKDATANKSHGQGMGMSDTSDVSSIIGTGQVFDGMDDYLNLGASTALDGASAFTISVWCKTESLSDGKNRSLFARGSTNQRVPWIYTSAASPQLEVYFKTTIAVNDGNIITPELTENNWNLVTITWDGNTLASYVNTQPGETDGTAGHVLAHTDGYNYLGNMAGFSTWNGQLDEVRIETTSRDEDWIKLCYHNQRSNQQLISFNGEDYQNWNKSRSFLINTSESGANISAHVIEFPLLVRLDTSNFDFSQAQNQGQDIRFVKSTGETMPFEIETWDVSGSQAEVWVLIDTVYGNRNSQYFTMHWGRENVSSHSRVGMLDEVLLSETNRSEAWTSLYIKNQVENNNLLDYAPPILLDTAGSDELMSVSQRSDGSSIVDIFFKLYDLDSDYDTVRVFYRNGINGAWDTLEQVSGDLGVVNATDSAIIRKISWEVTGQLDTNFQSDSIQIRLTVRDDKNLTDTLVMPEADLVIDLNEPAVVNLLPTPGDSNVLLRQNLVLMFNENMRKGEGTIFIICDVDGSIHDSILVSDARVSVVGDSVMIDPTVSFNGGEAYHLLIDSGAFRDVMGNPFAGIDSAGWSFSTIAITGPAVYRLYPQEQSWNVALQDSMVITFHEAVTIDTGIITIMDKSKSRIFKTISAPSTSVTGSGSAVVVIQHDSLFESQTTYSILLDSTLFRDTNGECFSGIYNPDIWNFVTSDVIPPVVLSLIPEAGTTDIALLGNLVINFNEPVFVDSGYVTLYRENDGSVFEKINLLSNKVTGSGSRSLVLNPDQVFTKETAYYVLIGDSSIVDSSGNFFSGTIDKSFWYFSTRSLPNPSIIKITSSDSGVFQRGDLIEFTIHFSDTLSLGGGRLVIPLLAGTKPRELYVKPFSSRSTLTVPYIVAAGDSTPLLDLADTLFLESGAKIQNRFGLPLNLVIADTAKLSIYTGITLDGRSPIISEFKPSSNDAVIGPVISYRLHETLKKGFVEWKNGTLNDSSLEGKSAYHKQDLSSNDLTTGWHEMNLKEHSLVNGAVYFVVLTVFDSAGNQSIEQSTFVKLIFSLEHIRISPRDTILKIGEEVTFSAVSTFFINNVERSLNISGVKWWVSSTGNLEHGLFRPSALGTYTIVGSLNDSISDTARVSVLSGKIRLSERKNDTVALSQEALVILPDSIVLTDTILQLSAIDTSIHFTGLLNYGKAFVCKNNNGNPVSFTDTVVLKIKMDTLNQTTTFLDSIQVYQKTISSNGAWVWYEPEREGEWLKVKVLVLDTVVIAIDTVVPQMDWTLVTSHVAQADSIGVVYNVTDNIANPEVVLRTHIGGSLLDSLEFLPYQKGASLATFIPPERVSERGLWYSLEVRDGPHLVSADTVDVLVELVKTIKARDTLSEGKYHFISIPAKFRDKKAGDFFFRLWGASGPEKWRLYTYTSKFIEVNPNDFLVSGRAYFLRTQGFPLTLQLDSGNAVSLPVSVPHSVPVNSGWTFISNPFFFPIPTGAVQYPDGEPVTYMYGYENGSWLMKESFAQLEPWTGYLVWNSISKSAESLLIHPIAYDTSGVSIQKKSSAGTGRQIGISIEGSGVRDGLVVMGYNYKMAQDARDPYDFPKPAFLEKSLDIRMSVEWDKKSSYLSDFRGSLGEGKSWSFRTSNKTGKGFCFNFKGLETIPDTTRVVLLDMSGGKYHFLTSSTLKEESGREKTGLYGVLIGTDAYLAAEILKFNLRYSIFSLGQIRPNPFSQITRIQYSLPGNKEGEARLIPFSLEIFDIKGKRVRKLLKGRKYPGPYSISWDGKDSKSRQLPTGTYFCRLSAGSSYETGKKILLLR
ncbi:MAG: DUF2341 domain-containing protein [Fibrobacteria bacterium]|nr:DUF2341 domain-containing protein [Fibrobacteria bacterium]